MTASTESFSEKMRQYTDTGSAKRWFEKNYRRVNALLEDGWVSRFVFEPVRDVFAVKGNTLDDEIRASITRVAVANAVLAGLPGKMGVGVFVSMGLEAWMAYSIATRVGVRVDQPSDIFKYFSVLASIGVTIVWLFKEIIGIFFSLFSVIPGLNPLIPAEIIATNIIGVLFWAGFKEASASGSFQVPKRAYLKVMRESKSLFNFQWTILKSGLSPSNLRVMRDRIVIWFRGEIPVNTPGLRGELFPTVAMAVLVSGDTARISGPLGDEFIQAIRDRHPSLADSSVSEIADHMRQYDTDSMIGEISLIKGKLFERLVTKYENGDGDQWSAEMHDNEAYPGSDVIFTNDQTGETIEVSLKATLNPDYIEASLLRYPEIPIMGPEELTDAFAGHPGYIPSPISHEEVLAVTEENFETLLAKLVPFESTDVAGTGVAVGATIGLWPFVVAYLRGRIGMDQLRVALERVLGEAGTALASRIGYAIVLGPVFAWYLLARGVIGVTKVAESAVKTNRVLSINRGEADTYFYTPVLGTNG